MRCGCIDIGTNTTRVLVAEAHDGRLREVLQRRVFTRLGRGLAPGAAIRERGVEVSVLDGAEEARLAFVGATRTLGRPLPGRIAVVDVGGGSSEIAIGTLERGVEWWRSFNVGSGFLADAHFAHDPPAQHELHAVTARVA